MVYDYQRDPGRRTVTMIQEALRLVERVHEGWLKPDDFRARLVDAIGRYPEPEYMALRVMLQQVIDQHDREAKAGVFPTAMPLQFR